jgi:hypothetical protein
VSPLLQLLHNHLSLLLIHHSQTAQIQATALLTTLQTFTTTRQENAIGSLTKIQVHGNALSKTVNGNSIKTKTVHGIVFTTNPVTYLATSLAKKLMIWN